MKKHLIAALLVAGCSSESELHVQTDPVPGGDTPAYGSKDGPHATTWHVFDDGTPYETHSSAEFEVEYHGDPSLYWYEPSGAHGMIGTTDSLTDFTRLREYIIAGAGEPAEVDGPMSVSSQSELETFEYATFTYILCDFWVPAADDPSMYELTIGEVDDGVLVLLNEEFVGYLLLGEDGDWSVPVIPGQTNSIVVILVDDSKVNRFMKDMTLTRMGEIIN